MKATAVLPQAGAPKQGRSRRRRIGSGQRLRPLKAGPGWRTFPSGPWRRSRAAIKAAGLVIIGWPPGGREDVPEFASGELCKDGCGCSPAEGQGHEGRGPGDEGLNVYANPKLKDGKGNIR